MVSSISSSRGSDLAASDELAYLSSHLPTLLPSPLATVVGKQHVLAVLLARYADHWHLDAPERGSGYRAISHDPSRRDGFVDPVIAEAAARVGWTAKEVRRAMKASISEDGWTIWCDPGCVSVRFSGPTSSGEIKELWGSLPTHLAHLVQPAFTHLPQHRIASMSIARTGSPLRPRPSKPSLLSASDDAMASPSKGINRAIPILAPSTAVRNRGVGAIGVTPPTPIPHRTVDEDVTEPLDGATSTDERPASSEDDAEEEVMTRPTTLSFGSSPSSSPASPGGTVDAAAAGDDPFARPSSRSSSGSAGSGSTSADSIFSLASAASSAPSAVTAGKPLPSSALQPGFAIKKTSSTAGWSRHHSTGSLPFVPSGQVPSRSLSPLGFPDLTSHSVPTSPRKPSHAAPSFPPLNPIASSGGRERQISAPTPRHSHSRSHSGQHGLRVREGPGTVTDYSGGKVGVMGGGVLLGLPKPAPAPTPMTATGTATPIGGGGATTDENGEEGPKLARKRGGRRGRGQAQQQPGSSTGTGSGSWTAFQTGHGVWPSLSSFA